MKVDKTDEKIISILKRNARTPYVEVARRVGLSEGAVRRRVDKLVKGKVIEKFTISVREVGYASAFVLVKTDPSVPTSDIVSNIGKEVKVHKLCEVAGPYEVVFFLEEPSMDQINEGIERIRGIQGVIDTSSLIVLRRH